MSPKVLIVDDSATARTLFNICITSETDFEVVQADSWHEAIEQARNNKFEFIVLDYNMPEKTGPELAMLMREQGINSPFVLMSANTQQSVLDEITALGFKHIVEKPVSAEKISTMLEQLL